MNPQIVPRKSARTTTSVLAEARSAVLNSVLDSELEPETVSAPAQDAPLKPSSRAQLDPKQAAPRKQRAPASAAQSRHFTAVSHDEHGSNRQAELFYLQKQIQLQTQMIFVLEDGSRLQGIVEWYDRHSIKIRGKSRVLIYKAAIKYLYKAGEIGTAGDS